MINTIKLIVESQKKKNYLEIKYTKNNIKILEIFKNLNFIHFFFLKENVIGVFLKKNVIKSVVFFSKPGRKIFCPVDRLCKITTINKIFILNTPQGLIVGKNAIRNKQGGELLCEITF